MSKTKPNHIPDAHVDAILENASIYAFVLVILTLVWILTGFGYYWPIWFLIGWLIGPQSFPFFKDLFGTFKTYSHILFDRISTDAKPQNAKSPKNSKPPTKSEDDSDAQGA